MVTYRIFSERTRAAAAAAAILPTVLAAASSARVGAKVQSNAEAEQFKVVFAPKFSIPRKLFFQ